MRRSIPIALSALLLAGCGSVSTTVAVSQWRTQAHFDANTTTLVHDVRRAADLLKDPASTVGTRRTVCAILLLDAQAANSALPTPDDQATTLLGHAYDDFGAGANRCYAARAAGYESLALASLRSGMASLAEGRARLDVATR